MKLPFQIDLSNKVAVVTGGGGVLCSGFAKTLAACGAKVAVCDLRLDAAEAVAEEIRADGGTAIGVCANVLERESLETAKKVITEKLGTCDILINGAGGNNPRGTTTKDYLEPSDLEEKVEGVKTFFDLDPDGVEFVFNLNFLGALIPTQVFALDMAKKLGMHTLCEGVETQEQSDFLREIGCERQQGYLFSKPIPEEEFLAMCS